jgi:hypothetical protein
VERSENASILYPVNKLLENVQYWMVIWYLDASFEDRKVEDFTFRRATEDDLNDGLSSKYTLSPFDSWMFKTEIAYRAIVGRLFSMFTILGLVNMY